LLPSRRLGLSSFRSYHMSLTLRQQALDANATGRFLDAFELFKRAPDSQTWIQDPVGAEAAIRVCSHLMQRGLAMRVRARLARTHPGDPITRRLGIRQQFENGQFIEAHRAMQAEKQPGGGGAEEVKWRSLRAQILMVHRDFGRAHAELDAAEGLWDELPWISHDRISIWMREDRLPEALELTQEELRSHPTYLPLRHLEAAILLDLDRREAALEAFASCCRDFQSPYAAMGHVRALLSFDRLSEARRILVDMLETFPLPLRARLSIHSQLALLDRKAGDEEAALDHARLAGEAGRFIASAIEADTERRPRVQLDVPFVRQDHLTCAPATEAANLSFLGVDVDQRAVAEEVTYDGTPRFATLRWAESQGLVMRFFEFDPAVAMDLIDRGLPFALSTRDINNAHLQGVIGYDPVLQTLCLREPGQNLVEEVSIKDVVRTQRARGGGAEILYPPELADRMPPGSLPGEEASMELVLLREDIENGRLSEAQQRADRIEELGASAILNEARSAIAYALKRPLDGVSLARERLATDPADRYLRYGFALSLSGASQWAEHRAYLEDEGRKPDCPPELLLELAEVLSEHAATRERAVKVTLAACRLLPAGGASYLSAALVHWRQRKSRGLAVELYRFAACLDLYNERTAAAYFDAARSEGCEEEALEFLRQRFAQLGSKSSLSAGGLAMALDKLRRPVEAASLLEGALAKNDHAWVSAVYLHLLIDLKRFDEAAQHLEVTRSARGAGAHLRDVAKLALARGELAEALEALDGALVESDQDVGLVRQRLDLIRDLEGPRRAIPEALAQAEAHANHPALLSSVIGFLTGLGAQKEAEDLLEKLIEATPSEHWLKARLGALILESGRAADAHELLEGALKFHPDDAQILFFAGRARASVGDAEGAREALRTSLELDPDDSQTLMELLQLAINPEEALVDLRAAANAFRLHSPTDGTLRGYLQLARHRIPEDELRGLLDELEANDSSNSELGMAALDFLIELGQQKAAVQKAGELRQRFPWSTDVGVLAARAHSVAGRTEEACSLLEEVLVSDPRSGRAYFELGTLLEAQGKLAEAAALYERGAEATGDSVMYGCQAEVARNRGQAEAALDCLTRAIELNHKYSWAHSMRSDILRELGRGDEALGLARDASNALPSWGGGLQELARQLSLSGAGEECVEVLRRALGLEPRLGTVRCDLVRRLGLLGRYDEARDLVSGGRQLLGEDCALEQVALSMEREAGDHVHAREQLMELLLRHPREVDGWQVLLKWLEDDGEGDTLLELYARPPEALKETPLTGAYAADVFVERDQIDHACGALRIALAVDPTYEWAWTRLAGLLSVQGRHSEVGDLFARLVDPDAIDPDLAASVAINAARLEDSERAALFLRRVLRDRRADAEQVATALKLLKKANRRVYRNLVKAAEADDPYGYAQANLAGAAANTGDWRELKRRLEIIWQRDDGGPESQAGLALVCSSVATTKLRSKFAGWLEEHLTAPVKDLNLWGLLGHVSPNGRFVIRLMGDDWQRPGAEPWMLSNLSDVYLARGRYDEMERVSKAALCMSADHTRAWHARTMGLAHLLRGEYEASLEFTSRRGDGDHESKFARAQLELLARLGLAASRRERVAAWRAACPELLSLAAEVEANPEETTVGRDFHGRICRAVPCLGSLLFLSRFGRRLLRS